MRRLVATLAIVIATSLAPAARAQVTHEDVEGIVNFNRIETLVACAGAITPDSVSRIGAMGFHTIVNLRLPTEEGADIEAEAAAAAAAGLKFVHLPFGGPELDPGVADRFLAAIAEPDTEPAFIHCAGGGRAATMWFIKRAVLDGWDIERARAEAVALGMPEQGRLTEYATSYLAAHGR